MTATVVHQICWQLAPHAESACVRSAGGRAAIVVHCVVGCIYHALFVGADIVGKLRPLTSVMAGTYSHTNVGGGV